MKYLKAFSSLALVIGLVYALSRPWGLVPALGPFISPFTGFWQNGEVPFSEHFGDRELELDSLREEVTIRFDDVGVPHIFAKNNYDLYYAQGYVTARDRLWQMDLQTRAAAGRLSEVLGSRTVEMDRKARRMGMGYGAEVNLQSTMSHPASRDALLGYTAGINAYIDQMSARNIPIEYKLLGYEPERWTPIKCMYMLEQMTLTLAGRSDDLAMTNLLKSLGQSTVDDLFPDYPRLQESPIIPVGTPWDFVRKPIPAPVEGEAETETDSTENLSAIPLSEPTVEGLGSNNWAIAARKSATGYPILSNDPHLELTLPSIWYQVQLHSPDMNVYGVSLPGIPGVVIGFNKNVAWGVTNVDADVLDLYKIQFRDSSHTEYRYNGQWRKTRKRLEMIAVKGSSDTIREMVVFTHHGPVLNYEGEENYSGPNLAARWIGHEPGNNFRTFYELNKARNYDDYRKAMTYYVGPAQNFVFADNSKNIAITVDGKLPFKRKEQGKYLLDGSRPADDWQGWIPAAQNPTVRNPPRGYVSSANQHSADPTYPYYINWRFAPSERAIRINERLEAMTQATADSFRVLQNDNFSVQARTILPTLLDYLRTTPLGPQQKAAFQVLESWDKVNSASAIAPSIFEEWSGALNKAIWADELYAENQAYRYPTRDRTMYMIIKQPDARWFDNVKTPAKETVSDIVLQSYRAALDTLTARYGPMSPAWEWAKVKDTEILHLSRALKPFNSLPIRNGGGSSVVNATTHHHGPSWRMVVELGPEPRAYGLYPGGQSGNPSSPLYTNMIAKWEKGELNELLFLKAPDDKNARLQSTWTLKKN